MSPNSCVLYVVSPMSADVVVQYNMVDRPYMSGGGGVRLVIQFVKCSVDQVKTDQAVCMRQYASARARFSMCVCVFVCWFAKACGSMPLCASMPACVYSSMPRCVCVSIPTCICVKVPVSVSVRQHDIESIVYEHARVHERQYASVHHFCHRVCASVCQYTSV